MITIGNKALNVSIEEILTTIQRETYLNGDMYLKDIKPINNSILVTCPFHKEHREEHPACGVFIQDTDKFKEGDFHCFACGKVGTIVDLVSECFQQDNAFAKEWLTERFGNVFIQREETLPEITFNKSSTSEQQFLDPHILDQYKGYHDYMWKRKLTKEVVDRFNVGYNKNTNSITFPIFDEKHRLVMITERCVNNKHFYIEADKNKPVYLLYDIIERNIDSVIVAESQINALTLRTWGFDSVALIGTGSSYQYNILKKSGIRTFYLALDGDDAGKKGIIRFIKNMPNDIIINIICIPKDKDVNDLSYDEFSRLEVLDNYDWIKRNNIIIK